MFDLIETTIPRNADERFMTEGIVLAQLGRGAVEPNPMVGAIIVRNGLEIARGYHRQFGGPHAEVEALKQAADAGAEVRGATIYVTLEPCCHHGKTPPCTDALLKAGIGRVVVAMVDPDAKVSGQGIASLRSSGVQVDVGVCEGPARRMLAAYSKLRTAGRPWVICKWAQTRDGYLALPPEAGRWISGPDCRDCVHELRAFCDGILIGAGTVLADDPLLTNRSGTGKQPTRVVLDSHLRTPPTCRLAKSAAEAPAMLATTAKAVVTGRKRAEALRAAGVELLELPAAEEGVDIAALLAELGKRQWTYLLVEGGSRVLGAFVLAGLADELWAFVSQDAAPADTAGEPRFDIAELGGRIQLPAPQKVPFRDDDLLRYVLSE